MTSAFLKASAALASRLAFKFSVGEYTDNFLAMRLPVEAVRSRDISENVAAHIIEGTNYIQVHPTFLYESLWNLMILIIMLVYRKHKKIGRASCRERV